jgi:hypothetical protein
VALASDLRELNQAYAESGLDCERIDDARGDP